MGIPPYTIRSHDHPETTDLPESTDVYGASAAT